MFVIQKKEETNQTFNFTKKLKNNSKKFCVKRDRKKVCKYISDLRRKIKK